MKVTRKEDMKTVDGPAEYFTGKVTIAGQTPIVTEGVGWTQDEGGPKLEFHAGDILWCPAEHRHWHGATPDQGMTHIAVHESTGPARSHRMAISNMKATPGNS